VLNGAQACHSGADRAQVRHRVFARTDASKGRAGITLLFTSTPTPLGSMSARRCTRCARRANATDLEVQGLLGVRTTKLGEVNKGFARRQRPS